MKLSGPETLFKIFPVILHLKKKFHKPISQTKTFQLMNHWCFGKAVCYLNNTFLSRHLNLESKLLNCVTPPQCIYVYTGKDTKLDSPLITADTSKTTAIVLKLVEPLLKQGQTVWMDNFYNSPSLARTLKTTHNTDCVGTLKLNRKDVPPKVKNTKLKKRRNRDYDLHLSHSWNQDSYS
jgi:hypothetical protein